MVYSLLPLKIAIVVGFFYLLRDLIAAVVENYFSSRRKWFGERERKVFNEKRARDPRGKNNLQIYIFSSPVSTHDLGSRQMSTILSTNENIYFIYM